MIDRDPGLKAFMAMVDSQIKLQKLFLREQLEFDFSPVEPWIWTVKR